MVTDRIISSSPPNCQTKISQDRSRFACRAVESLHNIGRVFDIEIIDSLDRPELAPYRTMREQSDHYRRGIFVAEGEKVVRRLLESDLTVLSLLLPPKWIESFKPLLKSRPEQIRVFIGEKEILQNLTGFSMYQGVLALARVPTSATLDDVLMSSSKPYLLAAVDGLSSAENLGVLVRNCAAFGVQGLIVGETSGSPYLRRAVRSSMGTVFRLPIVESGNLAETIRTLRAGNVRCIAAHPHTDRKAIYESDFTHDCCIVFGSEGNGISAAVRETCNEAVVIPMTVGIDSLNVGSASAAFLYEANRQRRRN